MLNEVIVQMSRLSKDVVFVRNLYLTFTIAIASLFILSDLQQQNQTVSEQAQVINMSRYQTKFVVENKK